MLVHRIEIMARTLITVIALTVTLAAGAQESIYHEGWIDFNKNGTKDIYEDPEQPVEKRVRNLLEQMTVEEKTCQLATLYGFGRVLQDSLPVPEWKNEIWKDGIANIDEQLNGVGSGYKRAYNLIYPFSSHAEAINRTQKWFVEETRLGIPVDFSNEGIHGLNHTKATPLPAPVAVGSTWNRELVRKAGSVLAGRSDVMTEDQAMDILSKWRALHAYPINTLQAYLRGVLKRNKFAGAIVAQRLKRTPSIVEK